MDQEEKDKTLWKLAKARVEFKTHLLTYIVINIFLWLLWLIISKGNASSLQSIWPIWATLGWSVGIIMHYFSVYHFNQFNSIEKEYEKLKKES